MKILITGGCGFIGSNLVKHLKDRHEITVVDANSRYRADGVDYLQAEVRTFRPAKKYDFIIHLAASTNTDNFDVDGLKNNVDGCANMIKQANSTVTPLILASSSSVYGNDGYPESMYASSKFMQEALTHAYSKRYAILRLFNVYGPNEDHKGKAASIIKQFRDKMKANEAITLYGNGMQSRDFIHVSDVCKAFEHSMTFFNKIKGKVIDIGTGNSIRLRDLVKLNNIKFTDCWPPNYQRFTMAKIKPALDMIGFRAKVFL